MSRLAITVRRIGEAVLLSLPADLEAADPAEALRVAGADIAAPALVVLDLYDVDLLTVRTARAVVAFAQAGAARGVDCVLLLDPSRTAAATVLDAADPDASVPRFATLGQALTGGHSVGHVAAPGPVGNTLAFDSADLGRTEEFLSTSYAPMKIGSATGRSGAHITRVAAGPVSSDRLDLAFEMSYDVTPLGRICLCDIESGTIEDHRVAGWRGPEAFGPGDLFSLAPPDRPYSGRICEARYGITMLDPALLAEVAGQPVQLLDHHPLDAAVAAQLRAAIAHLRDDVLGLPQAGENPLVVAAAARYLAASVLNAFPNTATPAPADERDARPHTVRRAIAFIEANADRDISAADIAAAARVSVRAVQLAFRRHLGMTPMAYLRQVRLDCARAELRAAAPGETTVTDVAARWGYGRPSVFAARYRAAYGESPSRTLRDTGPIRVRVRFHGRSDFVSAANSAATQEAVEADPVLNQFDALTHRLLGAESVADVFQHIAEAGAQLVPGADLVSVTVRGPDGTLHTSAWTDAVAVELDQAQHRAGPVRDVAGSGHVTSDDLRTDPRWPEFAAVAGEHGYRSVIVTELLPATEPDEPSGALALYSRRAGGLSEADRDTALLLAMHGSLALAHVKTAELADIEQAQMRRAVDSRDIIGQAKGILMHRRGVSADEAFDLLRRISQDLNVKLVDVAHALAARHAELD